MTQLQSDLPIEEILKLSEKFIQDIMGNRRPHHLCFTLSFPLSLHLHYNGYPNKISAGKYNGVDHFWISLGPNFDIIVDPSIRQFDPSAPKVFVGSINNKFYSESTKQNWFEDVYLEWVNSFLDTKNFIGRINGCPIKLIAGISLKATAIIMKDFERYPKIFSAHQALYLSAIILIHRWAIKHRLPINRSIRKILLA